MEGETCNNCKEILIQDGLMLQDMMKNDVQYFCDWDCLEEYIEGRVNQKEEEQ